MLALCAALLCISAWAAGETPSTADGTISINSAEELENFRDAVNSGNSFEGKTVVLGDNIDLNNEQWTPIGSYSDKPFSGIFDGGGHTISGLHVSGEYGYAGLFGVVGEDGTVKNLTVNGSVTGSDGSDNAHFTYTGGVAGQNHGTVADCSFTGTVTVGDYYTYAGGVVGCNAGGTVTNCRNSGDVTGTVTSNTGDSRTGGVAGESTGGTIENCYNTGNVNSTAGSTGDGYPGAGIGEDKGTAGTVEGKTEEEFATGAVANLLGDAYGQTLGKDNFPKLIAFDPDVPRVYRVTFDFNDGDVTPDQVSYTNGTVTLPAEPSAAGWRDGAGTLHEAGSTVTVTADVTYTAVWAQINIPDTYEIELIVSEGGEAKTSLSNASAGTTITVTAVPDEGYVLSYITVDGERISGTSFKMPAHDVTVRVYFTDGTAAFTDVSRGDWFYEYVDYVAANGLMEGVSDTAFEPDANMTRAMVWAVLARMDGEEISGANWAEAAREWAMESGVSDGTDPSAEITREQLAAMLHRFAGEPATAANLEGFTDAAGVSSWAVDAMSWCVEHGIITGVTDTTLSPQGTATRAQCAAMLMRFELR